MNDVIAGQPMWIVAAAGSGTLALLVLVVTIVTLGSRKRKRLPAQRSSSSTSVRSATTSTVLAAGPAPPAVPAAPAAPRRVQFGAGAENGGILGMGWAEPEDWGVWSNDDSATLLLPLPARFPAELRLECAGFVTEKLPLQEAKVSVDGVQLASWNWVWGADTPATQTLTVENAPAGQERLEVVFAFSKATAPDAIGFNGDTRRLGMALKSATFWDYSLSVTKRA